MGTDRTVGVVQQWYTLEGTSTDEGIIELQNICMLYLKVKRSIGDFCKKTLSDATQLDKTS